MVNAMSASLLENPVTAIVSLFDDAVLEIPPQAANAYGIPQLFEDTYEEDFEISKIPLLQEIPKDDQLKSGGRLVRCVVYVTHSDSEIFGGAYRQGGKWRLGRYGLDALGSGPDTDNSEDLVFEERTSLQCRLMALHSSDSLVTSMNEVSLGENRATRRDQEVTVKLYNEKEEGLLHACIDIVGLLEVTDAQITVHSLITKHQRLASLVSASGPAVEIPQADIRADLLQKLESVLQGDSLAAELTLLNLCSSVSIRTPILVGPIVLNLRNVEPEVAVAVSSLVSEISSHSMSFDMSIDNLNKSKLYPSHDGESFSPGSLQLPADSVVVLNESALSEGTVEERGVKNLQAMTNVINTQDLIFHFPFNEFNIPMDLSFLILSHSKSLLPSTISIALKKSSLWNLTLKSSISDMRKYLAHCRLQEIEISDSVSSEIQEDFVRRRKEGDKIDQEELSTSLALGKEICRSHGRRKMTWSDYEYGLLLTRKISQR